MINFAISFIITIILLISLIWGKDYFKKNEGYWLIVLLLFLISLLLSGYFLRGL